MPFIENSQYNSPLLLRNGAVATFHASLFRRVALPAYTRERLPLNDGDFLDLDWLFPDQPTEKLVVLTHGYLGSTSRAYMLGVAKTFWQAGWAVLAWNHRGLGGSINATEKITTHGSTDDLAAVITHGLKRGYKQLSLVGFSKGGNISMKYAGEQGTSIHSSIKSVVGISVPADLQGSMDACRGKYYERYFYKKLQVFLEERRSLIPPEKYAEFRKYRTLDDYTTHYIAPLFGWKTAQDYFANCACLPYLEYIRVPSLLLNARNDGVLSQSCSPVEIAKKSDFLFLETPAHGGHCAFLQGNGRSWADTRALEFSENLL